MQDGAAEVLTGSETVTAGGGIGIHQGQHADNMLVGWPGIRKEDVRETWMV